MPFLNISYCNFRNLANDKIDLLSKEVYFVGKNGQGKSNLLESLYFCAYGNSFRTRADSEIVKKGERSFSIRSLYKDENESLKSIEIFNENNKKRIEKNGKAIKDRKELINTVPVILFCHDDMEFITGEPEKKRFFVDQCLSLYDPLYIDTIRRYKTVLKNRNLILKEQKYEMLSVYDIQLVQTGLEIQKRRKNAIFQFNQIFTRLYENISGIDNVKIKFSPSWKEIQENSGLTRFPEVQEVLGLLESRYEQDKVMCTTMSGPHRDRITFIKDGNDFIPVASTGQRRLAALLLRVSQAVYYSQLTGQKPVLLMDDVMLELDPNKREKLTAMLPEYDQLFCTFLPGEPYERYKRTTTRVYEIEEGKWHEL